MAIITVEEKKPDEFAEGSPTPPGAKKPGIPPESRPLDKIESNIEEEIRKEESYVDFAMRFLNDLIKDIDNIDTQLNKETKTINSRIFAIGPENQDMQKQLEELIAKIKGTYHEHNFVKIHGKIKEEMEQLFRDQYKSLEDLRQRVLDSKKAEKNQYIFKNRMEAIIHASNWLEKQTRERNQKLESLFSRMKILDFTISTGPLLQKIEDIKKEFGRKIPKEAMEKGTKRVKWFKHDLIQVKETADFVTGALQDIKKYSLNIRQEIDTLTRAVQTGI